MEIDLSGYIKESWHPHVDPECMEYGRMVICYVKTLVVCLKFFTFIGVSTCSII